MSDDLTRLTDEERERIVTEFTEGRNPWDFLAVVESILAARTAALIDRAERAEREYAEAAFAVTQLAALRAAVTGLADEWANRVDEAYDYGLQLRALLTDEGDNG